MTAPSSPIPFSDEGFFSSTCCARCLIKPNSPSRERSVLEVFSNMRQRYVGCTKYETVRKNEMRKGYDSLFRIFRIWYFRTLSYFVQLLFFHNPVYRREAAAGHTYFQHEIGRASCR